MRGSAHELRSSEDNGKQGPLSRATSGTGEGWGEGRQDPGALYFRRRGQKLFLAFASWVVGGSLRRGGRVFSAAVSKHVLSDVEGDARWAHCHSHMESPDQAYDGPCLPPPRLRHPRDVWHVVE